MTILEEKPRRPCRCALLSAAAFLPAAAWSQQGGKGLAPDAMAAYGGRWSTACADASAPTLQVREDQLIVESGKRRVVGQSPETATASSATASRRRASTSR
jgi:hypothetical protein